MNYIVKGQSFTGFFRLEYQENGLLKAMHNHTDIIDLGKLQRVISVLPLNEMDIDALKQTGAIVSPEPVDTSFQAFWDKYGYKVGKIKYTQSLWKLMSEPDRIDALIFIPRYNQQLLLSGCAKAYPSTYLNQRYWDQPVK